MAAFETEAAALLGVNHALMVNSGTSAIICALTGIGVGPGDEVIVPGYTFIATAAAVVGVGAVPVIAEIDESLGMDPPMLNGRLPAHKGNPSRPHARGAVSALMTSWRSPNGMTSKWSKDCCQCVGGRYKGAYTELGAKPARGA